MKCEMQDENRTHWSRTFRSIPHRKLAELLCNNVCSNREKIYSILRQRFFGKWCFMFLRKNSLFRAHFAKEFFRFCEISQNFNPLQLSSDLSKQCKPHLIWKTWSRSFQKWRFYWILSFSEWVIAAQSWSFLDFLQKWSTLRCENFLYNGQNSPYTSVLERTRSVLSVNTTVCIVYSNLERAGIDWSFAKFQKVAKIPSQNEHKSDQ